MELRPYLDNQERKSLFIEVFYTLFKQHQACVWRIMKDTATSLHAQCTQTQGALGVPAVPLPVKYIFTEGIFL